MSIYLFFDLTLPPPPMFSNLPPALRNQQERDLTCLVIDDIKKNLDCLPCMYLCNGIFIRFHLRMPITPPILSEISKKNWMVKVKPFLTNHFNKKS